MSGLRDGLAQAGIIKKVDFKENFWEMKHYVYDSACLKCHEGIKEPEKAVGLADNIKEIHQRFYWDAKKSGKDVSCVDCHNDYTMSHFAHPNLLEALEEEE
jgi:cytochrome c-type protein NapC